MYLLLDLDRRLAAAGDSDFLDRTFVVHGYGDTVGPPMAEALKRLGAKVFVRESDPQRRARAARDGFAVVSDLSGLAGERLAIAGCANGSVISHAELASLRHPAVLFHVQSGCNAFDMDSLEKRSMAREVIGNLGTLPIVRYILPKENSPELGHAVVADGFSCNLAFMRPALLTEQGSRTNLVILESLRQGVHRLTSGRGGVGDLTNLLITKLPSSSGDTWFGPTIIQVFGPRAVVGPTGGTLTAQGRRAANEHPSAPVLFWSMPEGLML
jgi:hypothetical protein